VTNNLETALKLSLAGYSIFPCQSGGEGVKRPMKNIKWSSASTTDQEQIKRWWARWPDAAIGLDLAKSNLIVIDCDQHGAHDGVAAFLHLCQIHNHDIDQSPTVTTPNKGLHVFFKQQGKERGNRRGCLPAGIDVRGRGGYVIAPNTLLQDGRKYVLTGNLDAIPPLPDWLADILDAGKVEREDAPPPMPLPIVRSIMREDARAKEWVDDIIQDEFAILESAQKGTRNSTLLEVSLKIGSLVAGGLADETEMRDWLVAIARQIGLGREESQKTIKNGFNFSRSSPRGLPDHILEAQNLDPVEEQRRQEISNVIYASFERKERQIEGVKSYRELGSGDFVDEETGEVVTLRAEEPETIIAVNENVAQLEYPAGLVGEIARWIVATSTRPQPEMAIGAALTIVGTVAGRHFASPTKSATHLYTLGLAPTGAGKERPLNSVGVVLEAAGLDKLNGASDQHSMSSIYEHLKKEPLTVCVIDEFGDFMRKITSRRATNNEAQIGKTLRILWSSSFNTVRTPARASDGFQKIVWPAFSIFAMSTPLQFYSALKDASLESGTLNRFLAINGRVGVKPRDPEIFSDAVPQSITKRLNRIYNAPGEVEMLWRAAADAKLERDKHMRCLSWCPDGSKELFYEFAEEIATMLEEHPQRDVFYGRAAEMALRVATIIAIGRGNDNIRIDDLEYGIKLAKLSGEYLEEGAADYMAENENQANAQKIIRLLKAHKGRRMSHSQLQRGLQSSIPTYQLKDLLTGLCEAGRIEKQVIKTKTKPSIYYKLVPDGSKRLLTKTQRK